MTPSMKSIPYHVYLLGRDGGLGRSRIPELLDKIKGEQLGVSLLIDRSYCQASIESVQEPSSHSMPTTANLMEGITAFKRSLEISEDKA